MSLTTFSGPMVSQNGFIDTSFTTAERDAIVDPQPGLLIYNTTENTYQVCTVGGSTPTWESAFGGGGSGYPLTFDLSNTSAFLNNTALTFTPDGLNVVYASGSNLINLPLSVAWNMGSYGSPVSASLSPYLPPSSGYMNPGVSFNADGTKVYFVAAGMDTIFGSADLATPYNVSSITGTTSFSGVIAVQAQSVSFNGTGTKMYALGSGFIRQWDLTTPYDIATVSSSPNESFDLYNDLNLGGYPFQAVFNSTGTVGIVYSPGADYKGLITQFQLTGGDVSTINTTTEQSYSLAPLGTPIVYTSYNGIGAKPDLSKLYVGGLDSSYMNYISLEFNVTGA